MTDPVIDLPPPLDQGAWDDAALEFATQTLTRVRGTAEKWTGTISLLLGVFGSSAVFLPPASLAQSLPRPLTIIVYIGLLVVSLLALGAIGFGASAAQGGIPRSWDGWDGEVFAAYVIDNAGRAVSRLRWSRYLGGAAAVIVFAIGWAVVIERLSAPAKLATYVVVLETGEVACGPLGREATGTLTLGGTTLLGVRQLTAVPSCP